MRVPFFKMHGLGNDFVVLDARETELPDLSPAMIRTLCDRRCGIGCDQLIVLEPSATADFRMRIHNSDGGGAEACGNAARAVALLHGRRAEVETAGGPITLEPTAHGARVDMGHPRFDWDAIPLAYPMDTANMPVAWDDLCDPAAINVGNPHVVFVVDPDAAIDLATLGPQIEQDPLFPRGVNVNVASLLDKDRLRLDVWERGAGLTRACGTGACASAVVAMRRGLIGERATVTLPGGDLVIEWRPGETIRMTGPAKAAFEGSFAWEDYA